MTESWDQWQSILPDVQQVQANPHDPERHLWIATGQGVVQLTRDGKRHVNTLDRQDGQHLWVGDGYTQKFAKYEALTGRLVPGSTWGTTGIAPGAFWGIHYFTTDNEGTLYVGEDLAYRIQKFVPRKDGNPVQVIGPLM